MKYTLYTIIVILIIIFPKHTTIKPLKSSTSYTNQLYQTDSITQLWNYIVFKKGGCLGGKQHLTTNKVQKIPKALIFGQKSWKKLLLMDKAKLTTFLIRTLSDTTKTQVHTCPFYNASNGEMAVYTLQHIYKKNWYDFIEFKSFSKRKISGSHDQPQVWLQKILMKQKERDKLAELYLNQLKN